MIVCVKNLPVLPLKSWRNGKYSGPGMDLVGLRQWRGPNCGPEKVEDHDFQKNHNCGSQFGDDNMGITTTIKEHDRAVIN